MKPNPCPTRTMVLDTFNLLLRLVGLRTPCQRRRRIPPVRDRKPVLKHPTHHILVYQLPQKPHSRARHAARKIKLNHISVRLAQTIATDDLLRLILRQWKQKLRHSQMDHIQESRHSVSVPALAYVRNHMTRTLPAFVHHMALDIRIIRYAVIKIRPLEHQVYLPDVPSALSATAAHPGYSGRVGRLRLYKARLASSRLTAAWLM